MPVPRFVRKTLKWMAVAAVGAALLVAAANIWVLVRGGRAMVRATELPRLDEGPREALVVLGAGVWASGPSPVLSDRLRTAQELYDRRVAGRLLLTGDHATKTYDEPSAMAKWLAQRGVPDDAMVLDHAGLDTYSSMVRARDVFGLKRVVVVTQRFHLARALYIARAIGLDAVGVEAAEDRYHQNPKHAAREIVARPVAVLDCLRGRKPHFPN